MAEVAPEVRVVWADPIRRLAGKLRQDADTSRSVAHAPEAAELLENVAERLEHAIEEGAAGEWLRAAEAAPLMRIAQDSVRARCRRSLAARGLAKKDGGDWLVHVDALPKRESGKAA